MNRYIYTRVYAIKKTQVRRIGDDIIAGFAGAREVELLSVYSVITTAHAQRLYTFHTDPDNSHKHNIPQKGSTADCFTLMERLERKLEVKH